MRRKKIEKTVEIPTRNRKVWTEEDVDKLYEYWGTFSVPTIAKKLGRSVCAVRTKSVRLGLGPALYSSDLIPLASLFKEFGMNNNQASRTKKLKKLGFKIHTLRIEKRSYRMVDISEFWKFAEKHPNLFDFSKLEINALGVEPDWVKEVRTDHYNQNTLIKRGKCKWSEQEDRELIRLVKAQEFTRLEISRRLRRSDASVRWRIRELGIEEKPASVGHHTLWTDDEVLALDEMLKKGKDYEIISQALNRTASSVRAKVRRMYPEKSLSEIKESTNAF